MSVTEWLARCAEARAAEQPIPAAALFRQVVAHDGWRAAEGTLGTAGGAADAYTASSASSELSSLQQLNGLGLAAALHAELELLRLHFEPGVPPLVCNADEIQLLRSYLPVAVIEALLQRLNDGADLQVPSPFSRLRAGEFFVLMRRGADESLSMALAPDASGGRRLVAVFTAQDALQLFVAAGEPSDHVSMSLSGLEVFQRLIDAGDELDGIVFNAAGPTQPVALSKEVAGVVCDQARP